MNNVPQQFKEGGAKGELRVLNINPFARKLLEGDAVKAREKRLGKNEIAALAAGRLENAILVWDLRDAEIPVAGQFALELGVIKRLAPGLPRGATWADFSRSFEEASTSRLVLPGQRSAVADLTFIKHEIELANNARAIADFADGVIPKMRVDVNGSLQSIEEIARKEFGGLSPLPLEEGRILALDGENCREFPSLLRVSGNNRSFSLDAFSALSGEERILCYHSHPSEHGIPSSGDIASYWQIASAYASNKMNGRFILGIITVSETGSEFFAWKFDPTEAMLGVLSKGIAFSYEEAMRLTGLKPKIPNVIEEELSKALGQAWGEFFHAHLEAKYFERVETK